MKIKSKYKLANILAVCKKLSHPENGFKSIHVAGTNGKGSVCHKIASSLKIANYKVGLFSSPHISSFTQRIKINDIPISEKKMNNYIAFVNEEAGKLDIKLSFFEILTVVCFLYFSEKKVDFAVIEVGLGGRLDATNIITPILSVITSISYDHIKILGTDIEEIAFEKAGIIKKSIPVVIGPSAKRKAIEKKANQTNSKIINVNCNRGFFDEENSSIAKMSLLEIKKSFEIEKEAIEKGILTRPCCRFECFLKDHELSKQHSHFPHVLIFDVAHNKCALSKLFYITKKTFPNRDIRLIFGMSKDKDIDTCIGVIKENVKNVHLVEALISRSFSKEILLAKFIEHNFKNAFIEKTISISLKKAFEKAHLNDEILIVCGSFYIMQEARSFFGINEKTDAKEIREKLSLI
jgi:dihydrofolate synthase / folylpolyglutamate synthase